MKSRRMFSFLLTDDFTKNFSKIAVRFLICTELEQSNNWKLFHPPTLIPHNVSDLDRLPLSLAITVVFAGDFISVYIQGFGARAGGIWLEPEPSIWPGSGSTLNICLIVHANYMELNFI